MIKSIFFVLLLSVTARAEIPLVTHCTKEFYQETKKLGSADHWTEQAPSPEGYKVFRTPTNTFGTWLEAAYDKDHTVLYTSTVELTTKMDFGKDCKMKVTKDAGMDFRKKYPDPKAQWLDDKELMRSMEKHPAGLIYVWSPGMTYSVQFYKRFEEVAKEMNIPFVAVLDPRSSLKEVAEMGKKMPVPSSKLKLNSVELYMRNVTTHYPGSLVFKNRRIHADRIIGVMEKDELKALIKKQLDSL